MDKVIYSLSHGMYVLTTPTGGCIVDAVSQVGGGTNPLVSIAVMKTNNTNELMHKTDKCCLPIIGKNTSGEVIREFGLKSMRDYDKFTYDKLIKVDDLYAVSDSIGYLILEKIDTIENDTHTLFICRVIDSKKLNEDQGMTYNYYRRHKDELLSVKTEKGKTAWVCATCGYVFYGEILPENYTCPNCGVPASFFHKQNKEDKYE